MGRTYAFRPEHGYNLRHVVHVRFSTYQSTGIAYVTGCTYAFRPISARCSRILISVAPCGGLRNLAQPQKSWSIGLYITTLDCVSRSCQEIFEERFRILMGWGPAFVDNLQSLVIIFLLLAIYKTTLLRIFELYAKYVSLYFTSCIQANI